MLKSTFLLTALVFDLEFEGHAVGMWRRTRITGLSCGEEIRNHGRSRTMLAQSMHECHRRTDGRTDRQTDKYIFLWADVGSIIILASDIFISVSRQIDRKTVKREIQLLCSVAECTTPNWSSGQMHDAGAPCRMTVNDSAVCCSWRKTRENSPNAAQAVRNGQITHLHNTHTSYASQICQFCWNYDKNSVHGLRFWLT